MSGLKIPALPPKKPITFESRFTDLNCTFMGEILFNAILSVAKKDMKKAKKLPESVERDNKIKGAMFLKRIFRKQFGHHNVHVGRNELSVKFCDGTRKPVYNDTFVAPLGHDYEETEVANYVLNNIENGDNSKSIDISLLTEWLKGRSHV